MKITNGEWVIYTLFSAATVAIHAIANFWSWEMVAIPALVTAAIVNSMRGSAKKESRSRYWHITEEEAFLIERIRQDKKSLQLAKDVGLLEGIK